MRRHELPEWRPGETIRSMHAVATVLGGEALRFAKNRIARADTNLADRLNPPESIEFPRATINRVEAPVATEAELDG